MSVSFLGVFGKRLKKLRGDKTIQRLAEETGINRITLTNYENGTRHPDERVLTILAKHFNVSLDYLVGISDVMSYDANIHSICKFTGLSEKAVILLRALNNSENWEDSGMQPVVFSDMINTINSILEQPYLLYAINDYIHYSGIDKEQSVVTKSGYEIEINDKIIKAGLISAIRSELDTIKNS